MDGFRGAARGVQRARAGQAQRAIAENGGAPSGHMYCTACGTQARPEVATPGSLLIEIVLWICFLVPGIIYSLWRISARRKVCGACRSDQLIPPGSPRAMAQKNLGP